MEVTASETAPAPFHAAADSNNNHGEDLTFAQELGSGTCTMNNIIMHSSSSSSEKRRARSAISHGHQKNDNGGGTNNGRSLSMSAHSLQTAASRLKLFPGIGRLGSGSRRRATSSASSSSNISPKNSKNTSISAQQLEMKSGKKKRRLRPNKNLRLRWSDEIAKMMGSSINNSGQEQESVAAAAAGGGGGGITSCIEARTQNMKQAQHVPIQEENMQSASFRLKSSPRGVSSNSSIRCIHANNIALMHASNATLQTLATAQTTSSKTLASLATMGNSTSSALSALDMSWSTVRRGSLGSRSSGNGSGGSGSSGNATRQHHNHCVPPNRASSLLSIPDDIEVSCFSHSEHTVTLGSSSSGEEEGDRQRSTCSEVNVVATAAASVEEILSRIQSQQSTTVQADISPPENDVGPIPTHDTTTAAAMTPYPRSSSLPKPIHTTQYTARQPRSASLTIDLDDDLDDGDAPAYDGGTSIKLRPALIDSEPSASHWALSIHSGWSLEERQNAESRRGSLASRSSTGTGGGRPAGRGSESSLAAASWLGSMGDSDASGSSSDCDGDGPDRQRLRTRRRRKRKGRRRSACGDASADVVIEGEQRSTRGAKGRRRSAPSTMLNAFADLSDFGGDASLVDSNEYEEASGSRLDAILARAAASTTTNNANAAEGAAAAGRNFVANNGSNNNGDNVLELYDLFRPHLPARSSVSSWPNRANGFSLDPSADRVNLGVNPPSPSAASPAAPAESTRQNIRGDDETFADESFANVEDLLRSSPPQPFSSVARHRVGTDQRADNSNSIYHASWPHQVQPRDSITSDSAVLGGGLSGGTGNRSESILDRLQTLDLRQVMRDNDASGSSFNIDENDIQTQNVTGNDPEGRFGQLANPLMVERESMLGFGRDNLRMDGQRLPLTYYGISDNSPATRSPPINQRLADEPIRGLDALGEAIGALAAAAPDVAPVSTTRIPTSGRPFSHRSASKSSGGGDSIGLVGQTSTTEPSSAAIPTTSSTTRSSVTSRTATRTDPTPLYEAVASGACYDTIKSLIDSDPGSTGHQNGAGLTPLHCSIERYDMPISVIRLLLASNPSTAIIPKRDGRTPLDLVWRRFVDPDSYRTETSRRAANELATLMETAVFDDGCSKPPKEADEDIGEMDESDDEDGLSQRGSERKGRAMRILLSNPPLRDFWDLIACFVRAAHYGTVADPLPSDLGRWRIVHSCVATRCEPLLIRFAAALYPEQLSERDEQTGRLPLHITAALSNERSANSVDKTILRLRPTSAWCHDNEGRLPINVAIEAGKPWRFVRALMLCAPRALTTRDTKTHMMPFMLAAASDSASLDCSYRLLRDSCDVISSVSEY